MARKPTVRYFPSRGGYYCQHLGKQHKLALGPDDAPTGPTYDAALNAFRRLMRGETTSPGADEKTVESIWQEYRRFLSTRRSATTLAIRSQGIEPFVARHGKLPCRAINHGIVYAFMDGMRKPRLDKRGRKVAWGDGSVKNATEALAALLNWGVKAGLLSRNPLAGIEMPRGKSRGEEYVISDELHRTIISHTRGSFRDLILCLEATGARPSELTDATARDFDAELGCIIYRGNATTGKIHKTARKTGKDRTVYLSGKALDIVRERVKRYPTGPLFGTVNRATGKYTGFTGDLLTVYFRNLRVRLGLTVKMSPYSYRHTFATKWLLADRSIEKLAELLGNSPKTIMKHYSHLTRFKSDLRADLERFRCETTGEPMQRADGVSIAPGPG
jgi:integrase/recombinase XerC